MFLSRGRKKGTTFMAVIHSHEGVLTFVCDLCPTAQQVYLSGNFNNWAPRFRRMVPDWNGGFNAKVKLPPGSYEYKFVIDGRWVADPAAAAQAPNPFGSFNSIVEVDAETAMGT